jgi:hypothetical protein
MDPVDLTVSDPYSFDTNPDPALKAEYRSGSRVLTSKNLKKFTADKNLIVFYIKNYNLPIPRPPERISKLQRKPSALKKKRTSST